MNWKKKIMAKKAWKTLSKDDADGNHLVVHRDTESPKLVLSSTATS